MPSADPVMPPTTSDPSTISIGALSPTARDQAGSAMLMAAVPAISRVTSPRPSVTTSRVRWLSRCPTSTPITVPSSTADMFTTVPMPGNICLLAVHRAGIPGYPIRST